MNCAGHLIVSYPLKFSLSTLHILLYSMPINLTYRSVVINFLLINFLISLLKIFKRAKGRCNTDIVKRFFSPEECLRKFLRCAIADLHFAVIHPNNFNLIEIFSVPTYTTPCEVRLPVTGRSLSRGQKGN